MGRATSGVIGMRFDDADELLAMEVVAPGASADLLVATSGGYAKRTALSEYPVQGRGGKGVLTAKIVSTRGGLVGALVANHDDHLYAITSNGGVLRTVARDVRRAQRQTMGVRLIDLEAGVQVVGVARNADADNDDGNGNGSGAGGADAR
jgi:DNA gyrase subunit A